MGQTPTQVLEQIVLAQIYNLIPDWVETSYDIIDGSLVMADGGDIYYNNEDHYTFRYRETDPDVGWTRKFAKYVSKWFWKAHPMPDEHEFFIAKVVVDSESRIKVMWGTR